MNPATALELVSWRRETAALYARVRDQADPAAAHALWRDGRDTLLRSHPQSPVHADDPIRVRGVPYWLLLIPLAALYLTLTRRRSASLVVRARR